MNAKLRFLIFEKRKEKVRNRQKQWVNNVQAFYMPKTALLVGPFLLTVQVRKRIIMQLIIYIILGNKRFALLK